MLGAALFDTALTTQAQQLDVREYGDTLVIHIHNSPKYLLLPIEEDKPEAKVLLDNQRPSDTWMDVRLAVGKVDYEVPFALNEGKESTIKILNLDKAALAFLQQGHLRLSNEWDVKNTDYYRPLYHHTPSYGWMNDPNGMFYKDGIYHLCYQYNPYGSKWGNMHWGHATTTDLIHWKASAPALDRDPMGHIYSGSSVIDKSGTAGFGKDAIIALYTSASDENGQIQCLAYSTDGGYKFTKYEHNPVLRPFDGLKDFRDPKVFWFAPKNLWYMIVSADKEMRFYSSPDLKDWTYVSNFGQGYGAQPNQFECPDFFRLPVDGNSQHQKYVMIVNINPGCLFGGSATEYFVGEFDGKNFVCDDGPKEAKFLDYGKDHYATVTFSGTGDRVLGLAWMSNWQYANVTPIKQYRGANTLPRELFLFAKDGETFMGANVAAEVRALRKSTRYVGTLKATEKAPKEEKNCLAGTGDAFELEMDITPSEAATAGFELYNSKGERVKIYFDTKVGKLVMDRMESGLTAFGEKAESHQIEKDFDLVEEKAGKAPSRKTNPVNYKNDFALGTWAPLNLCKGKSYHVDVFVDKCSVEIFVDGGRIAMTNLVFPTLPYESVKFYTQKGTATFKNVTLHRLGL